MIDENEFKEFVKEAKKMVRDEKDTSFVALTLKLKPSIIMTYNVSDYLTQELSKRGVKTKARLKKRKGFLKLLEKIVTLFKRRMR